MKTPTLKLKLYAVPLALLVLAGGLAPAASAAEKAPPGLRIVQKTFAYNPNAPAEQIYAKLNRFAKRMCKNPSPTPLSFTKVDDACVAEAMQDGIRQINRTDLAQLYSTKRG